MISNPSSQAFDLADWEWVVFDRIVYAGEKALLLGIEFLFHGQRKYPIFRRLEETFTPIEFRRIVPLLSCSSASFCDKFEAGRRAVGESLHEVLEKVCGVANERAFGGKTWPQVQEPCVQSQRCIVRRFGCGTHVTNRFDNLLIVSVFSSGGHRLMISHSKAANRAHGSHGGQGLLCG